MKLLESQPATLVRYVSWRTPFGVCEPRCGVAKVLGPVDVTEEFPFLVTKLSTYYDR